MGRLTTHVLDTAHGKPAGGMAIVLSRVGQAEPIKRVVTNADGRVDGALLEGDTFAVGTYDLTFAAGAYFRAAGVDLPEPAFLDEVVIRFGIAEPGQHYHVPLLVSPYAYSTYRGS